MNDKRYQVIYSGKLKPGLDTETVKSNLILSMGIAEGKADRLLETSGKLVLKRCSSSVEAQVLAEKFDQAGLVCVVRNIGGMDNPGMESGGESSLVRLLKSFTPSQESDSPSLFRRLVKGGHKRKRA